MRGTNGGTGTETAAKGVTVTHVSAIGLTAIQLFREALVLAMHREVVVFRYVVELQAMHLGLDKLILGPTS